jgi:tRNA dimethylallyltransferase
MLESGLLDETRWLFNQGLSKEHTCMQAIGYKEMIEYIKGDVSYDEAVAKLKLNTRHYAKRQLTWFRNERGVRFIDVMKEDAVDMIVKEYEKHV